MFGLYQVNRFFPRSVFLLAVFWALNSIHAETLVLKDGRTLKGKLLQYHSETIDFQTEEGQIQSIDRKTIVKIQYGEDREAEKESVVAKPTPRRQLQKQSETPNYVGQSALIPGLGLISLGKKREGYVWAGVFLVTTLFALHQRKKYLESRERYEESIPNSILLSYATKNLIVGIANNHDKLREFQYQDAEYNKALLLCGMVYLGQLAWTYYAGKPASSERSAFEFHLLPVLNVGNLPMSHERAIPLQVHFQYHFLF